MPGPLIKAPELPWWLDPKQESVMDPLMVTLARKAAGLVGLDDPSSQVMSMAGSPLTVAGKGIGAAAAGMLPFEKEAAQAVTPSAGSTLLQRIFAKNPEAEGIYSKAMASQLPEAMEAKRAADAARYGRNAQAHDALLDLHVSGRPNPIPTDTGYATAIPLDASKKGVQSAVSAGNLNMAPPGASMRLQNAGLTEQIIKDIRSLGIDVAAKKYPEITPSTIKGIAKGDAWTWVK